MISNWEKLCSKSIFTFVKIVYKSILKTHGKDMCPSGPCHFKNWSPGHVPPRAPLCWRLCIESVKTCAKVLFWKWVEEENTGEIVQSIFAWETAVKRGVDGDPLVRAPTGVVFLYNAQVTIRRTCAISAPATDWRFCVRATIRSVVLRERLSAWRAVPVTWRSYATRPCSSTSYFPT